MNDDITKIVAETIESKLDESFQRGVLVGWYAFAMQAYKNIDNYHSIANAKKYFKHEADKTATKLGLLENK